MAEPRQGEGQVESPAPWWKENSIQWAITTLVALFAVAVPLLIWGWTQSSSEANELRKCMELRELRTTPQKIVEYFPEEHSERTGEYRKTIFASCTWPPSAATAGDGYSEVVAIFARGPGEAEATSATYTDRVIATCLHVEFTYQVAAQGYFDTLKPFTLQRGAVAYAGDGEARPWTGSWEPTDDLPYPAADEIVVLHDGKVTLSSARCLANP